MITAERIIGSTSHDEERILADTRRGLRMMLVGAYNWRSDAGESD